MALRITTTVLIGLLASTGHAASGFFNLPSTLPQRIGCGYGPGYHAEMVLKPYYRSWNAGKGIVRAQPHEYPAIYPHRTAQRAYAQPVAIGPPPASYSTGHQPTPSISGGQLFTAPPAGYARPEEVPPTPVSVHAEPDPLP